MKMINLTPHTIKIKRGDEIIEVQPSGTIARVSTIEKVVGEVDGIEVVERNFGEVEGLPEPEEGVIYLVSALVGSAIKNRNDVYMPDTGSTAVRNEKGFIEYVTRLVKA